MARRFTRDQVLAAGRALDPQGLPPASDGAHVVGRARYSVHPTLTLSDEEVVPRFDVLLAEAETDVGAQDAVSARPEGSGEGNLAVWDHTTDLVYLDGSASWGFPRSLWPLPEVL
jgi:hypothetical protein